MASHSQAQTTNALLNKTDSVSYVIGTSITKNFKESDATINYQKLIQGINDALGGKEILISDTDKTHLMQSFQAEMSVKAQLKSQLAAQDNIAKGQDFLAKNKKNAGVVELPSGLQYKVIKEGTGAKAKLTDKISVHYTGSFITGEKFDSSVDRKEPLVIELGNLIKGWQEGIQLMAPGAKYMFYIPYNLGYGSQTKGPIPGGSALVFEVELLEIVK